MSATAGSVREYVIKIINGMALGLFASLIIGLILRQIGDYTQLPLLVRLGGVAQLMMGPAIGAGVAFGAGATGLGMFASVVTGAIGAGTVVQAAAGAEVIIGEPVGALVAAWVGAEAAKFIGGRTKLDVILVPAGTIVIGGAAGVFVGPAVSALMTALGGFINLLTGLYPLPMGVLVSVTMGAILTLPISSAALAISLGLEGLAAGAATIGCSTQMIGFAVISFRDNGIGGSLSQGIGTSMLQFPNIVRKPQIWLPVLLASAVIGPLSTVVFQMENSPVGAGMGTSGLVGQIATLEVMGASVLPQVLLLHFILPAVLSLAFATLLRRRGLLLEGDLTLYV